ncbi:MAG TPA: TetR family transcriptional regulator [Actinophytocola sp.]|jgi:DNA-binding transcriptional regulator YbjK|uniref:TetR/AcrR family transcriptional regulator n=1 Tax=Actinophytocola sp. TaxID=1872138 RepID=UPI002F93C441
MASDRRDLIADATIATIARAGMRGLTHRAVDRAAGLPEGSTSYYFRTREALLFAALARMAELDVADIGQVPAVGEVDEMSALLVAVMRRWLTSGRERTQARFELSLEATRRPELRAKMTEYGSGFRLMPEKLLAAAGIRDARRRAQALVSFIDGVLFHQIAQVGAGELSAEDLASTCRDMVAMALR